MKQKHLEAKGESDYDYRNDILFFKTEERKYAKSIELDNIVLDIDSQNFIVGIQILEASRFLNMSKTALMKVASWVFKAKVEEGRIEIRLTFQTTLRNKIIEKNPIIMQDITQSLPNSELMCKA